jgi:periplasmic protein TonB
MAIAGQMRIIYIHGLAMAVQILNDLPDAEVHRGDPVRSFPRAPIAPRDLVAPRTRSRFGGRAGFLAITIALHVAGAVALLRVSYQRSATVEPAPIEAALLDSAPQTDLPPPNYTPPPMDVVYTVQTPPEMTFETDAITQIVPTTEAPPSTASSGAPPLVDSVEYVRAQPPVYPKESQRKREHGTVLLRVLVDSLGRPAQVQIERSSGFSRLDAAAREAVEKFLFHPYEVNGVAQPAQVLIPIGFDRHSS